MQMSAWMSATALSILLPLRSLTGTSSRFQCAYSSASAEATRHYPFLSRILQRQGRPFHAQLRHGSCVTHLLRTGIQSLSNPYSTGSVRTRVPVAGFVPTRRGAIALRHSGHRRLSTPGPWVLASWTCAASTVVVEEQAGSYYYSDPSLTTTSFFLQQIGMYDACGGPPYHPLAGSMRSPAASR
ncbi:hypothetical protein BDW02DRAFT_581536 [Decorospora gaudefroyi]|uniref:Secreted protein n=1 Tax=Decorospora gaudefroyi TaxID=184978 RepID=A0A6A5K7R4_9PLEO|nr:hypothetical protein BDW02DRAFT_581536 [Decorospora gaudefroyi]